MVTSSTEDLDRDPAVAPEVLGELTVAIPSSPSSRSMEQRSASAAARRSAVLAPETAQRRDPAPGADRPDRAR